MVTHSFYHKSLILAKDTYFSGLYDLGLIYKHNWIDFVLKSLLIFVEYSHLSTLQNPQFQGLLFDTTLSLCPGANF